MHSPIRTLSLALLVAPVVMVACGGDDENGVTFGQGTTGVTASGSQGSTTAASTGSGATDSNGGSADATGPDASTASTTDGATDGATDGPTSGTDSDGIKLDVGPDPTGGSGGVACDPDVEDCGCTAVDVVFVIDNSASMQSAQEALAQAFPQFADAMIDVLPPGTSLHVAITSTEMGDSNSGTTTNCTSTGDGGKPQIDFYITPDVQNTGVNGAQGRLFQWQGKTFYELSTDASPAEVQGLKDWFGGAAVLGTGGSNLEMSCAAAGWVGDPANDATNAGFIRDAGAVLVLFFIQDEPDQTPQSITGTEMLAKLAARKAACGGTNCIIGGGIVNNGCLPMVPLGEMLANLGAPAVTQNFPFFGDPTPAQMVAVLKDTLAGVIAQKCEEIPPPQ